jgi:hypothetical protein
MITNKALERRWEVEMMAYLAIIYCDLPETMKKN